MYAFHVPHRPPCISISLDYNCKIHFQLLCDIISVASCHNVTYTMSSDNSIRPRHDLSNTPSINHWLFRYPFLFPLITELLHDEDVLERLLLTGKSIKPFLLNYPLKRWISQKSAQIYRASTRYLSVVITRMTKSRTLT